MNDREVDVRARVRRELQQEFLEPQLRVDEIPGCHDGSSLLEQRPGLRGDLRQELFARRGDFGLGPRTVRGLGPGGRATGQDQDCRRGKQPQRHINIAL